MSFFSLNNKNIKRLVDLSGELKDIGSTIALLSWDQETYLTAKGAISRSQQLETLSGIYHQRATAKSLGKLIDKLWDEIKSSESKFSGYDVALVREMKRDYTLSTKLPEKLVREMSKESSLGLEAWKHARNQNDFSIFAPSLTRMVELKRQTAELLGYEASPYDALLNEFEDGLTKAQITKVFDTLKQELGKRIPKLVSNTAKLDRGLFTKEYDTEKLWKLSLSVLENIGFDMQRGRQDQSTHPFTMGLNVDDVRLTTRVLSTNPISTIMSSIHEGGHGMYEQGISPELTHTTIGYVNSLVVHESQSRFWENMVGKSKAFWEYFFPQLQATFPEHLSDVSWEQAWEEVNVIRPSLIRVDADEVTYHMHIIIRTEVESELIEGKLDVKDVEERWNAAYKQYLGVDAPTSALGCLQDIHWSQGLIGYFPTYSLGSLFSAQLFATLEKEKPEINQAICEGKFEQPLHWLNEKIHQHGRLYSSGELCKLATGEALSPKFFLNYIDGKFGL